jgi:hypothetical protein
MKATRVGCMILCTVLVFIALEGDLLQRTRFPVKQRRREAAIGEEEVKKKKNRGKQEEKLRRGRECKCKCRQSPDREFSCHELSLCATTPLQMCSTDQIVMRCPSVRGGSFIIRPRLAHVVALLRISGPVVDTALFHRVPDSCGLWAAEYSRCREGTHYGSVYRLFEYSSPHDEEAVLLGKQVLL